MFSALKKLVGSEQAPGRDKNIPAGLQSMNQALQRRFAKGVQYNMKIVIRGDRNTGKTALWHRLQGKKFVEEYIPTQEIQVTSIHWNYKRKCKKRGDGLKTENDPQEVESEMALDAEFLDVYKNCNGVVMMFDITKQWTFNYVLRELPKVPTHVPVCVLGNYRDMGEHRVILPDDVRDFIDHLDRPPGSSYFRYAESSMKNSFGLKYLHKFFNIPFLQLQRETLLRQLETNQLDIDATLEELSVQQETEDQNYSIFLEMMEARSRGHASPLAANGQSPSSGSQSPVVPPSAVSTGSSSPSTPQPAPQLSLGVSSTCPQAPSPVPPLEATPSSVHAPAPAPAPAQRRSIISRLFGTSPAADVTPAPPEPAPAPEVPAKVQNVEDFVPEDGLDRSFLEDTTLPKDKNKIGAKGPQQDSDSDDGEAIGGNPMVAGFQDDVDIEDQPHSKSLLSSDPVPSKNISLSSEEEAEEPAGHPGMAPQQCSEPETKWSSTKASHSRKKGAPTRAIPSWSDGLTTGSGPDHGSTKPPTDGTPRPQEGKDKQVSSESDPEGPIAAQMLSFVMDDPDFESDESDTQRRVGGFPVREDLSDVTDEDTGSTQPPPPSKPPVSAFRLKNDSDLFGLGLEETGPKESSDEDKDGKLPSKEKKKKKKKSKEEEEKATKKKSKHKKNKDKEEGKEDRRKKRKPPRSKEQKAADELEAFLGGGAPGSRHPGGGDYEEL
ncbi:rab-like protein 6 isoform X2 [Chionomys nivalis]|uniref:rab-like protein 6 isoform X2 n=1 Tax=Chionomys nivalis TaxID=269649 RepID=UPI0025961CCA|nr:rab-like protein 6 isoform X2 [Chionomys nivalis]